LDTANECLWRRRETTHDERVLLTPKAFAVLRCLVEHAGRLVTQEELLDAVWPGTYVQPEVLKSRIFEVRSALGDRPKTPRFIETLPRRGYRFIATVHDGPAAAPALRESPAHGHLGGREGVLATLRACLHLARGQCLEGYGGTEAYYPMLEALGQLWRGAGGDVVVQALARHAPTWLV
jgi:DNA-binding winged helix-turn-helix (wHTH) protein